MLAKGDDQRLQVTRVGLFVQLVEKEAMSAVYAVEETYGSYSGRWSLVVSR